VVTGGTGLLGGLVAGHLAATGRAGTLLLLSRSGPAAPGAAGLVAGLAARGTAVSVVACDAADRAALAAALGGAGEPVRGVVHTAGVLDDGVIGSLNPDRLAAVMRPKSDAAWFLHELTEPDQPDLFVLFSSAAAAFGSAGQGNYAAANAFLDGLATHRRAAGQPAVSVAWGMWAGASAMTSHLSDSERARISRGGMTALQADEGLELLDAALARDEALLVATRLDIAALRAEGRRGVPIPALWRDLAGGAGRPAAGGPGAAAGADALRQRLAGLTERDRARILVDVVRTHVAAVLGHASAGTIEPDRAFSDLGFDSLTAIELRNQLHAATGLRLSATLVFDYPSPEALAEYLAKQLTGDGTPPRAAGTEEIAKLEQIVHGLAPGDQARLSIAARVKALLSELENGRGPAAGTASDRDLETATAESIFGLLDKELGES
jgi:acyl carrier protein